ncbi:TniQ family protein [Nocardia sp. NPDC050175]|uniref:TniQ family protein n=1 Tax=Nocardia sp. NPDC050175 TaxID=3364317 RepID=UPI0037B24372
MSEETGVRRCATIAVLPGTPPRRLSHVLVPAPGEAWVSWLDRVSVDLGLPPGLLVLQLGVQVRAARGDVRPVFSGLVLTPASRAAVVAATGLDESVLIGMQLSRYDGTALDLSGLDLTAEPSVRTVVRREWLVLHGSRACPKCLAESPVWPTWWRLGIAAVCPEHRVLLVASCPQCGIGLRRGYRGSNPRGLSRVVVPDPWLCGNHVRGGHCRQPVAQIGTIAASDRLIAVQRTALAAAEGAPVTIAGTSVLPAEWFTAVKLLAAMIRFSDCALCPSPRRADETEKRCSEALATQYRQRRENGARRPGDLRAMPDTPEITAGLLAAAQTVLGAADANACADAVSELAVATDRKRRQLRGHNPFRVMEVPAPLAVVLARFTRPASRVAGAVPPKAGDLAITARNVPQLLDVEDYRDLIGSYLPGTAEPTGRRLAALAVARVLGAHSWPHAARQLDMDPRKAARAADVVVCRIGDVNGFWTSIDRAAARLDAREPVDYASRRQRLKHLDAVPYEVLRATSGGRRFPVTPERRRHGAAWIWSRFTGGDVRDAPAYQQSWDATDESVREGARRFAHQLPGPVAEALIAWTTTDLLGEASA